MMRPGAEPIATINNQKSARATSGIVLHSPALYDFIVWLAFLGKESEFRQRVLKLASLHSGECVLDVGCGTGTLAIAARSHVGATGKVCGLDASPEMLAKAEKKASRARVEVVFKSGIVENMPFPDAQFDAVLSTVMLHHLPRKAQLECAREMRRVAKPGGRILVVDFDETHQENRFISFLHRRHGHVSLRDLIAVLNEAGLQVIQSGALGIRDLNFALARLSCCS